MDTRDLHTILVIYDSQSGFTEKMAHFIGEGAKKVQGMEVEVLKIGKPFSLSKLERADAIILGSPNIYQDVTHEMKDFLDSLKDVPWLYGKIGGVFGSYTWSSEVVEKLSAYLEAFGMRVVAPRVAISSPVSMVYRDYEEIHIHKWSIQQCRDLGKAVAEQVIASSPTTLQTPMTKDREIQVIEDRVKDIEQQLEQVIQRLEILRQRQNR
jgi:NAD(P)H dehydrogenase (quinone)